MHRSALASVFLLLAGCATMRIYHTPVTAPEGALAVPALVSTAESMGLQAWAHGSQCQVQLQDGTNLYWYPSSESFMLSISLRSGVAEADYESAWREAKVRADQIWELAMQARQQSNLGAAVLINTNPTPAPSTTQMRVQVPGMSVQVSGSQVNGSAAGSSCRSSVDCGSGQFCKDHGGGVMVCMGNGGQGAPCTSGIDCGSGLFCRGGACAP